jgi:hypothetical protein
MNKGKREQLNLAYEWKQIDVVKNCIMKNERDWKVKNLQKIINKLLNCYIEN